MPSSTFQINSILKLVPVLSQELKEMQLVRTFCTSTANTSTVSPIFLFHDFDENSASFNEKKIGKNLCSSFWQFYQIVRIELTTGRIPHIQIKSTLERKVKTGAFNGIF